MLAEITLASLRRAESALGPGAALGLARAALGSSDGALRRTVILAGLGIAIRAEDGAAFASLASEWASAGGDESERRAISLVARLVAADRLDEARRLARAERERHPSADAAIALGAVLEREGAIDEAEAAFAEAVRRAPASARAREAALPYAAIERADEAEARLSAATPDVAIRLAPAALASGRVYTRVRALDRLAELASTDARTAALRVALAFADRRGASLSEIERDRVRAIAMRAGADPAILAALSGASPVDANAAREALVGQTPLDRADRAGTVALRALASAVRGESSASMLVSALTAHPPSPAGWTAVLVALSRPASRAAAVATADRWLAAAVAPPRGFADLAAALARAEAPAAAERAWLAAALAAEPGARKHVAARLAARAVDAYRKRELAEAKALLERSLAIDPEPA